MEYIGKLLEKLRAGKRVVGTHINCNDLQMTEIAGEAGAEYVWIDTEHTAIERRFVQEHLIAARAARIPAFVRIPWNDKVLAKPILEYGPDGIIFPMISSAQEARDAVAACLYPPRGVRGFGPKRANRFGSIDTPTYLSQTAPSVLKVMQIETREAVAAADEIAALEGVDIVAIGPVDLSGAYGKLTLVDDPEMIEVYRGVFAAAHRHGKFAMISHGLATPEAIEKWVSIGADLVTLGSDYNFVCAGVRRLVADFERVCGEAGR